MITPHNFMRDFFCAYGAYRRIKTNPQNLDFAESEERGGKTQKQTEFVV